MSTASELALDIAKAYSEQAKMKLEDDEVGQLSAAIELAILRYNEDYWQRDEEDLD